MKTLPKMTYVKSLFRPVPLKIFFMRIAGDSHVISKDLLRSNTDFGSQLSKFKKMMKFYGIHLFQIRRSDGGQESFPVSDYEALKANV